MPAVQLASPQRSHTHTTTPLCWHHHHSRPMNQYFLIIACLQLWAAITPVNPLTTWAPLIVIFTITAVKELMDDLGRRREDAAANSRKYNVIRAGKCTKVGSSNILVGDVVKLLEDEEVPADMVVLCTSDPTGVASIQTTNLDGESNLKARVSLKETRHLNNDTQVSNFKGVVVCQNPDQPGFDNLEKFDAALELQPGSSATPASLSISQLLLQATHLRQTEWVYGLVVYTGNETKFGKNKKPPPSKLTKTDKLINQFSVAIFLFQLVCVAILGVVGDMLKAGMAEKAWYLGYASDEPAWQMVIIPLRFLLLNSTMIPISLKVTLDLCKLYYAKFINSDLGLYCADTDTPTHSNSTALSEDLGQVQYVLSDKTGTLTENVMVLKVASVLGQQYGVFDPEADNLTGGSGPKPGEVDANGVGLNAKGMMEDRGLRLAVADGAAAGLSVPGAFEFMRCLALNNTVIPDVKNGHRVYKASSPDEEALTSAAAAYGVSLLGRQTTLAEIALPTERAQGKGVNGLEGDLGKIAGFGCIAQCPSLAGSNSPVRTEVWDTLVECEFNSDRKRMSVLVRQVDPLTQQPRGPLRLYTKGADDVILARLAPGSLESTGRQDGQCKLQAQIDAYASAGLRTLVMAYRDVPDAEYAAWRVKYDEACALRRGRDEAKEVCFNELEQHLHVLGASAIEDKLQDEVPQTIAMLKAAGIKIWMCTGDKFSTAQTIAKTCKLWPPGSVLIPIEGETSGEVKDSLKSCVRQLRDAGMGLKEVPIPAGLCNRSPPESAIPGSVVVPLNGRPDMHMNPLAGASSSVGFTAIVRGATLFAALEGDVRREFAKVALAADAVICCRVTPKQKADLVRLVKDAGNLTIGIGDGGNDVSMIQEAHVGVGIRGKEGLQAARASDYAVPFFRALKRLVLLHGRYSYHRTSLVTQYSFYKSFLFCFLQIGFAGWSSFSGVSLFNSLCVAAYNAVLFVPIVYFFLDRDLEEATVMAYPDAYKPGAASERMNWRTMFLWFLRALYQAVVMVALIVLCVPPDIAAASYESIGLLMFAAYLAVQDVTMLLELRRITWYNVVSILGLHLFAYLVGMVMNSTAAFGGFIDLNSFTALITSVHKWLFVLVTTVIACAPVEFIKAWHLRFVKNTTNMRILQEWEFPNVRPPPFEAPATGSSKPAPASSAENAPMLVKTPSLTGARGPSGSSTPGSSAVPSPLFVAGASKSAPGTVSPLGAASEEHGRVKSHSLHQPPNPLWQASKRSSASALAPSLATYAGNATAGARSLARAGAGKSRSADAPSATLSGAGP